MSQNRQLSAVPQKRMRGAEGTVLTDGLLKIIKENQEKHQESLQHGEEEQEVH